MYLTWNLWWKHYGEMYHGKKSVQEKVLCEKVLWWKIIHCKVLSGEYIQDRTSLRWNVLMTKCADCEIFLRQSGLKCPTAIIFRLYLHGGFQIYKLCLHACFRECACVCVRVYVCVCCMCVYVMSSYSRISSTVLQTHLGKKKQLISKGNQAKLIHVYLTIPIKFR